MELNQLLITKKIFRQEFPKAFEEDILSDFFHILSILINKLDRLANNKSLPSIYRVNFMEDIDSLNSVINDLKKFA